jgi:hypothetical protein
MSSRNKAEWPDRDEWVNMIRRNFKIAQEWAKLDDLTARQDGLDQLAEKLASPLQLL